MHSDPFSKAAEELVEDVCDVPPLYTTSMYDHHRFAPGNAFLTSLLISKGRQEPKCL